MQILFISLIRIALCYTKMQITGFVFFAVIYGYFIKSLITQTFNLIIIFAKQLSFMVTNPNSAFYQQLQPYVLTDYSFLQDYQILQELKGSNIFIARIINTPQLVKFTKVQVSRQTFERFQALVKLFQSGIILADNIFILQQNNKFFYYIIEAYINLQQQFKIRRFRYLKEVLQAYNPSLQTRKQYFKKIKILLQRVHQHNQPFCNLTPQCIILDEDNNIYLSPYHLKPQFQSSLINLAYKPPEILQRITNCNYEIEVRQLYKWDIWAFGCICVQLFLTVSPVYYCSNIPKMLQMMERNQIIDQLLNDQDSILVEQEGLSNLIKNCLTSSPELRCISTSDNLLNKKKTKPSKGKKIAKQANMIKNQIEIIQKHSQSQLSNLSIIGNNRSQKDQIPLQIKRTDHKFSKKCETVQTQTLSYLPVKDNKRATFFEDNLNQKKQNKSKNAVKSVENKNKNVIYRIDDSSDCDSKLNLTLLNFIDYAFQQQLHIVIHLDKQYHLYADPAKQTKKTHILNLSLEIQSNFSQFSKILKEPILIELKQRDKTEIVRINLQTLIIVYGGKRIWNKVLIGSYPIKSEEEKQLDSKLKIKCELKSPEIINSSQHESHKKKILKANPSILEEAIKEKYQQAIKKQDFQKQNQHNNLISLKDVTHQHQQKQNTYGNTFKNVKQSLQDLADYWKKKRPSNSDKISEQQIKQSLPQKISNLLKNKTN